MVVTPASMASAMPVEPWACAAVRRPALRAPQRLVRGEGGRIVLERAHRVRLGAQTEMHVAIDETREQGMALEVDPPGARRPRDVHDLSDAALLHHDGAAAHRLRARAVDQGGAHQDE